MTSLLPTRSEASFESRDPVVTTGNWRLSFADDPVNRIAEQACAASFLGRHIKYYLWSH
jgi:hypothetical protein